MSETQKIVVIDVETTGLRSGTNGLIEFSAIAYLDTSINQIKSTHGLIKPMDGDAWEKGALRIHGQSKREQVEQYGTPSDIALSQITWWLEQFVNKFDKNDKLIFMGFNCKFDINALIKFFQRNNNNFFWSYFDKCYIDVFRMIQDAKKKQLYGLHELPNRQLSTVYEHLTGKSSEGSHGAEFDCQMTIDVYEALKANEFSYQMLNTDLISFFR